jgi:hypothetical protein
MHEGTWPSLCAARARFCTLGPRLFMSDHGPHGIIVSQRHSRFLLQEDFMDETIGIRRIDRRINRV